MIPPPSSDSSPFPILRELSMKSFIKQIMVFRLQLAYKIVTTLDIIGQVHDADIDGFYQV